MDAQPSPRRYGVQMARSPMERLAGGLLVKAVDFLAWVLLTAGYALVALAGASAHGRAWGCAGLAVGLFMVSTYGAITLVLDIDDWRNDFREQNRAAVLGIAFV